MIRRLAPRQGGDKDPTLDFAQGVDAGFAVVWAAGAVVDVFDRRSVEHRSYVEEVDSVLDEVGLAVVPVPLKGHC